MKYRNMIRRIAETKSYAAYSFRRQDVPEARREKENLTRLSILGGTVSLVRLVADADRHYFYLPWIAGRDDTRKAILALN